MEKIKGMTTCCVCGRDFPLIYEEHYTARDGKKTGVASVIIGEDEPKIFDAFDCPHCGCQNIMQERKGFNIDLDLLNFKEDDEKCNCYEDDLK